MSVLFLGALQAMTWNLYEHSRSDRVESNIGVYQDVLDIAQELRIVYKHSLTGLTSNEMKAKLRKDRSAIELEVAELPKSRYIDRKHAPRGQEIHSAVTHSAGPSDTSPNRYRPIARRENSHWVYEDVVVHWPAKRQNWVAPVEQTIADGDGGSDSDSAGEVGPFHNDEEAILAHNDGEVGQYHGNGRRGIDTSANVVA